MDSRQGPSIDSPGYRISSSSSLDLVHWLFRALTVVELVLVIGSYFVMVMCFYVFLKVKLFHKHFIRMIQCGFIYFMLASTLRLILLSSELAKKDQGTTFNSTNYIVVDCTGEFNYLSWIRAYFLVALYATMGTIVFERLYATKELAHYEKTESKLFHLFVFLYQNVGGAGVVCLFYYDYLNVQMCGVAVIALNVAGYLLLMFVQYFNQKRHRLSLFNTSKYTLSERFQLQENIRTAKLMQRAALLMFCMNLVLGTAFITSYYFQGYVFYRSCYVLFNMSISCYAYAFPIVGILSSDSWKVFLLRTLQKLSKVGPSAENSTDPEPFNQRLSLSHTLRGFEGRKMVFTIDEEREVYFEQLNKNWR